MAMVVHDLRTPLTVSLAYTQALLRRHGTEADRDRDMLGKIEAAIKSMSRLVDDLLDATRLGTASFTITPTETDLVSIVRRVVEDQRSVDSTHHLIVESPDGVIGVWDELRLSQVVTNLVVNARTYSPATTEIRVAVTVQNGAAVLSVTDQGPGIPADQIDRLFQPFVRLEPGRSPGAGLGLYISRGIAEAHGGRLWVTSAVGEGSTFWVELPTSSPNPPG
jgi:two-component system phosphate regulon sensor histidine kinase PhoR